MYCFSESIQGSSLLDLSLHLIHTFTEMPNLGVQDRESHSLDMLFCSLIEMSVYLFLSVARLSTVMPDGKNTSITIGMKGNMDYNIYLKHKRLCFLFYKRFYL